jgi:hypothetical protein
VLGGLVFSAYPLFAERTEYRLREVRDNFADVDWDDPAVQEYYAARGRMPPSSKSLRQRIDIVHPHSFLMPVLYFILCHLMEMTRFPRGAKMVLFAGAFAAMAFVISAPLLIHRWPATAVAMIPALGVLWLSFGTMAVVPVAQMWFGRSEG